MEAQAADKALMTLAAELVLEWKWTWDDALYEVTFIRAEMMSLFNHDPGFRNKCSLIDLMALLAKVPPISLHFQHRIRKAGTKGARANPKAGGLGDGGEHQR